MNQYALTDQHNLNNHSWDFARGLNDIQQIGATLKDYSKRYTRKHNQRDRRCHVFQNLSGSLSKSLLLLWFVCAFIYRDNYKAQPLVVLEKPEIDPSTPGLQGIVHIHYTTAVLALNVVII